MENPDPNIVESWIQETDDDITGSGTPWYVVSMTWLNKWRAANNIKLSEAALSIKIADNRENNNTQPDDSVDSGSVSGSQQLSEAENIEVGPVDSGDIIEEDENHIPSLLIKPNLIIGKEIEILPKKAWDYFSSKYSFRHEIIRYSIQLDRYNTKVEIYPKQVNIIFFNENKHLTDSPITFHISIKAKKQELEQKVLQVASSKFEINPAQHQIFLWKFSETHDLETIKKMTRGNKKIPAKLLGGNDEISELEIADEDIVLAEIALGSSNFQEGAKRTLDALSSNRRGLTGLQNLGNTCFMNSGIQCLSNTHKLTEYLLSGQYKNDINKNNRIGTQGNIVTAYAELIKELWTGSSSSVSPWGVKKSLGKITQQFVGFSQQDSQELLSFLIDGIHEDLNQALKPKPTDLNDAGLTEEQISNLWWEKHLERNKSIIVDLMHGQYKSEVTCKVCGNVSLAFDPFLMWTLPVPSTESFQKEIIVIKDASAVKIKLELTSSTKISDIPKKIPESLKSGFLVVGECEDINKDVRRIVAKNETVEKSKDYLFFYYDKPSEDQAAVICNFSSNSQNDYSRSGRFLGAARVLSINSKGTLKDFHFDIFKQIFGLTENNRDVSEEELRDIYRQRFPAYFSEKKDNYYSLAIFNPGRHPCAVCQKENCYGCAIPYSEESVESCIRSIRERGILLNISFKFDKQEITTKISQLKYSYSSIENEEAKSFKPSKGLSVYDCIQLFQEVEELEESERIYCRNCKQHQLCSKKMDIYRLPEHLIIHLKRFRGRGFSMKKNDSLINFPLNGLEVKELNGRSFIYDLYAVSNHYGGMGGGHYTAFGKNINGGWYSFNDSSVSSSDQSSVVSTAAYVLFYKRR